MDSAIVEIPYYKTERGKAVRLAYYLRTRESTRARVKAKYLENPAPAKERAKKWAAKNRQKRLEILRRYAANHKESELLRCRLKYRKNPKATLERLKKWQRKARLERPQYVIKVRLRGRLYAAIRRGIGKKIIGTLELVGCTLPELQKHIESQFKKGMSWDRIKQIHIDHIVPCSAFDLTTIEGQRACFHYSNLQPLWKMENLRKSAKTDGQRRLML